MVNRRIYSRISWPVIIDAFIQTFYWREIQLETFYSLRNQLSYQLDTVKSTKLNILSLERNQMQNCSEATYYNPIVFD